MIKSTALKDQLWAKLISLFFFLQKPAPVFEGSEEKHWLLEQSPEFDLTYWAQRSYLEGLQTGGLGVGKSKTDVRGAFSHTKPKMTECLGELWLRLGVDADP